METTAVPQNRNPATPEEIWAILRETAEIRKETERIMRESAQESAQWKKEHEQRQREYEQQQKEYEQRQKEYEQQRKERDAKFDKLSENVGGLNRSVGDLIEILIAANLWEKFPEYNLQRAYRRITIYNEKNEAKTDIDILLVNNEWAMVVEVKRDADKNDVIDHVERMKRILKYPPLLFLPPHTKILSAIAAGVITPEAIAYAHECGFFVLELTGESVVRVPAPAGFMPMEYKIGESPYQCTP